MGAAEQLLNATEFVDRFDIVTPAISGIDFKTDLGLDTMWFNPDSIIVNSFKEIDGSKKGELVDTISVKAMDTIEKVKKAADDALQKYENRAAVMVGNNFDQAKMKMSLAKSPDEVNNIVKNAEMISAAQIQQGKDIHMAISEEAKRIIDSTLQSANLAMEKVLDPEKFTFKVPNFNEQNVQNWLEVVGDFATRKSSFSVGGIPPSSFSTGQSKSSFSSFPIAAKETPAKEITMTLVRSGSPTREVASNVPQPIPEPVVRPAVRPIGELLKGDPVPAIAGMNRITFKESVIPIPSGINRTPIRNIDYIHFKEKEPVPVKEIIETKVNANGDSIPTMVPTPYAGSGSDYTVTATGVSGVYHADTLEDALRIQDGLTAAGMSSRVRELDPVSGDYNLVAAVGAGQLLEPSREVSQAGLDFAAKYKVEGVIPADTSSSIASVDLHKAVH